jgi:hypothetical protein
VDDKLARLDDLGFVFAGQWSAVGDGIDCDLSEFANCPNALYAFAVDNRLMYVGKTTQPLRKRIAGYRNPSPTQATNVRNNKNIREALGQGKRVDVYVFRDTSLLQYGGFHLNLAAGLEDDLVLTLDPPWNGCRKDQPDEDATIPQAPLVSAITSASGIPTVCGETSPPIPDRGDRKPRPLDFVDALSAMFAEAFRAGESFLEVRAGQLHRKVGGYDGPNHRMVPACNAMRKLMRSGDQILDQPPKGNGASLKIRYILPRPTV